ncbi:hypothetical protein H9Q13_15005 [Pontibacter sp. JH31]|uniref:Uncharacterized protein n=1 Tax=Pontibacter aquaedesilientis TaxID=2766980 RepID=A0ABR7XJJ1_9BACT|nr:hypothetical protein [Pontibacter aquaedesilientis]MBD1398479.1 hypothetical protein [Pontibacter aquaedesilientis]
MKLLLNQKKIGKQHLVTQLVALIVLTKGEGLFLMLALSEAPGWIMLALWILFNYFILVALVNYFNSLPLASSRFAKYGTTIKVLLIAVLGGLISFAFDLIYYRFHFYYIGEEYSLTELLGDIWSFMIFVPPVIAMGEIIRRKSYLSMLSNFRNCST